MRRLALLCLVAIVPWLHAAPPFPHAESDLRPDPKTRFGTLANGMRYVIRANAEPKNRASLRLVIHAGSLHENTDQSGLAHFLEHMAFNGTKHYAPGTLIEFFQRMGMNFGGDTNASTGFDRTLYMLELPDTKEATLAEGLRVFSDYADGILLREEDIQKERGIILSEKRTRDSVGYRTIVAQLSFMLQGSRFPERWPIGDAQVIAEAGRDRFLDFYDTWYRPERTDVVIVGDIDPDLAERLVRDAFGNFKARAPARPDPDLGRLDVARAAGVRTFFHSEPEAPETNVAIVALTPYAREPDTAANRLKYLPRSLANAIINRRLSELAKKEDAPFTSGSTSVSESFDFYRESTINLSCRADQWAEALAVADQELRRALEHGFQPAELKEVVANFRNSLDQAVKTAPTRRSESIAGEIADTLVEGTVFTAPADDQALYLPALERVTVQECVAALRQAWAADHRLVMVSGNAKIDGSATDVIRTVYDRAHQQPVAKPAAIADAAWAYDDFGPAGKIERQEPIPDLGITLVRFANGVRLNLKPTDFEANRIRLSLRVGHGQLTEPRDQPGLAAYFGQTFTAGGLGKHSSDDLRRILAGKTVGAGFSAGADAFVGGGSTNRDDLLLQLQLMTAYLVDPGFRPEAARQARKAIEEMYLSLEHTPSGPFTLEVSRLLASGDPRFGLPSREEMLKRNLDEVKAWALPALQRGYLEIGIVGDLDVAATIDAVARTLGALPTREPFAPLEAARTVKYPEEPFARSYAIPTEIPKGVVAVYWPTTDALEIHRTRRMSILALVLADRLRVKVREELGDAYSPGAGNNPSEAYPGYGYMAANVTIDPPRAQLIADAIVELASDLAEKGAAEDEVQRAKQPVLTQLRESARTNQYWLGAVVARAQERPQQLEWCRSRYADIESIGKSDIDALAALYLKSGRASRVVVVPQKKTAADHAAEQGATPEPAGQP